MELRAIPSFKSVMLSLLVLSCVRSKNEHYYVKPTSPQDVDCPGHPCQHLKHYSTEELDTSEIKMYDIMVTMLLIEGNHSVHLDSIYNFGSPVASCTIHVVGNGQNSKSGVTVEIMILEKITATEVYNIMYTDQSVEDSQITNISISNCAFVKSAMMLKNIHLNIKDSNFSENTWTAIMLYSSTLTVVGHVRFLNNKGYQGGALMLIGTVIQISKESNLLFQENYAEKLAE